MALTTAEAGKLDSSSPGNQQVSLGTEVKANQDNITNIKAGLGITLPTSDPSVAGVLWANSGVVTVSAG